MEHLKNVASKPTKCCNQRMDFHFMFWQNLEELKQTNKFDTDQPFYHILNLQKMCNQSQPSGLIKVWTFISCFDRDLWEMKQTNKFDTDQLFYYILNTRKMWHQSQPSVAIKVWTFISCFDRILKYGLSLDDLAEIFENWSRITSFDEWNRVE